jgi:CheY-like chemotaxis protein
VEAEPVSITILIVEDEADLGALLTDVLRSAGDQAVLTTGGRAADRAEALHPDAIVTDYRMPGSNGAEVIQQIRSRLQETTPPVILLTGLSNAEELASAMGAHAFLRKPFDVDTFLSVLSDLVQ